jgi:hypothetical protein
MNKFNITFQCYGGLKFFVTLFTFYDNISCTDDTLIVFSLYWKFLKTMLLPQFSLYSAQQFYADFIVGFSVCVCKIVLPISRVRIPNFVGLWGCEFNNVVAEYLFTIHEGSVII